MSLFGRILGSGEKLRKKKEEEMVLSADASAEKKLQARLPEKVKLLTKKTEFLEKKIDRELLCAKENCRKNRIVALQALRRKKWLEEHLSKISCTVEIMISALELTERLNKVNDLIMEIIEEDDLSDSLSLFVNQDIEFDEDELLAELDRLEESLYESPVEEDRSEDGVQPTAVSSFILPSDPAEWNEDEDEDVLEYLRRWAT